MDKKVYFKKIVSLILAVIMLVPTNMATASAAEIYYGDMDENGRITATDLSVMKGIVNGTITPTLSDFERGDLDGDGEITEIDLEYLNLYLLREITEFPIESMLYDINIKTYPSKRTYYVGEKLDTSGLVVEAEYNNGTTKIVKDYEVEGSTSSVGTRWIEISYTEEDITAVAEYSIEVKKKSTAPVSEKTMCTVSFDANGGTGNYAKQTVEKGLSIKLNAQIPSKYYKIILDANGGTVSFKEKQIEAPFLGWCENKEGKGIFYRNNYNYTVTKNITLYAYYGRASIGSLPVPQKKGYVFQGWFANKTGKEVNADTKINETTYLYAAWKKEAHIHTSGEWKVIKEATAKVCGEKVRICTECGEVLEREVIPKLEAEKNDKTDKTNTIDKGTDKADKPTKTDTEDETDNPDTADKTTEENDKSNNAGTIITDGSIGTIDQDEQGGNSNFYFNENDTELNGDSIGNIQEKEDMDSGLGEYESSADEDLWNEILNGDSLDNDVLGSIDTDEDSSKSENDITDSDVWSDLDEEESEINDTDDEEEGEAQTKQYSAKWNKTSIKLKKGKTAKGLKVTVVKGDKIKSYYSTDKKIATVSKTGKITAKKAGTAYVVVVTKKGAIASLKVVVQNPVVKTKKIVVQKRVVMKKGKSFQLKATVKPSNSTQKVTYKSSNSKIAKVSKKGMIKGVRAGRTTITVKSGKKTVKVTVVVKK